VLVRAGALPGSPPAHRDGAGAGRRGAHPGPGTRALLARDVFRASGGARGDRPGGRGERGDPAGNGRPLGGSRVRARGAGPGASARRRPGRRCPRAGGGLGRGAGRTTALLDHLRAVLAGLRGASQRRPRGRARGVRRGRRPRARGWLQRAHRAPRHHAGSARPRRRRHRGRVGFLRHRAGVAQADEEPLVLAETMVGQPTATARPAGAQVLRVSALGPLEISLDGERLLATAWGGSDAKPRELLLYLLCHPAGRTGEQTGLALWRDASPAQRKNAFHVTLHQLRRILGRPDWIVFEEERYRINPRLAVEFDGRQFETELRLAQAALVQAGDAAPLARALARYRGDLLEDTTGGAGDWHL